MERTVLVTGASSGIGLATVLELARVRFTAMGLVRDEDEAASLGRAAADAHLAVDSVVADLADLADLADVAARARAVEDLELYALVNDAGYMNAGLVRDVPFEDARTQLETMVVAPVDRSRRVLPHMLRRGEGRRCVSSCSAPAWT